MTVKLVTQGTAKSQVFNVLQARTVIGRQEGCAVRIPSGEVSRRHCVLVCEDGNVMVEDLDSCNGTYLNGKRIKSKRLVHPGDSLQIGPVTFTVDYSLEDTDVQPGAPARSAKGSTVDVHEAAAATRHATAAADTQTDPHHPALQEEPDDVAEAVIEEEDFVEAVADEDEVKRDEVEQDDVVEAKLAEEDSAKPWDLPHDEELRDILSHLDESADR